MPALSPTMEDGTLSRWLVSEGDIVKVGDIIAEIETDKATMEIEAIDDGVLSKILVPEGSQNVLVNSVIAHLSDNEENKKVPTKKTVNEFNNNIITKDVKNIYPSTEEGQFKESHSKNNENPQTGNSITVREALRDAIAEEMRKDDRVFLMGEEVAEYQGAYKVSQGLLEEFGSKRVIDTPITEYGFTGIGVGAAFRGLKPIVEFMTFNFAMQAIDHIVNSAAKTLYMSGGSLSVPIVFRGPNGAASRVAAQHSQNYASWYSQIPGLKVVAPYSAADAKGLLKSSILDPNPIVFLENELLYGEKFSVLEDNEHYTQIGKAKKIIEGSDVTIISYSISVKYAIEAADYLSRNDGVSCEVIDLRTLSPLDIETIINSLKKTNRVVVVEEGWSICGIASEISALIMEKGFDDLDAPVIRVTGKNVPMPYAANLEKLALPSVDDIVKAVKAVSYI
ncbi:MAG: 2-oxoisovalerate dehydrogenase subunit beta [Alphaproteobacteria bacterium MarineAlpha2_Bin1]|nr:MAG: 2-oxoisovalerate dehydrogenase subunit beta [Alphaproteobacteria bacterium MarineAlpha2_Bin1]